MGSKKHGEGIMTFKLDGSKERRKYVKGHLQETTKMTPLEMTLLTKSGGFTDKILILSYFDDPYQATSMELRSDVINMVKKKENAENVWYTLLALHIYTNRMKDKWEKLQSAIQSGLVFS